jgi:pimeloyl-ACP methyl ester carboxylesterase
MVRAAAGDRPDHPRAASNPDAYGLVLGQETGAQVRRRRGLSTLRQTHLHGRPRRAQRVDLRPRLSRVTAPTLVLCGSDDRVNIALSKELAAGMPSAELRIIPGATHLWNLQHPDVFNQTVATFTDRVVSPRP